MLWVALCATTLPVAFAQTAAPPPVAGPAPLEQRSAFEGYRPFEAGEVQDWRRSNDTVRDVGGWRAYAREMQGPASSAGGEARTPAVPGSSDAPAPAAAPRATDPHAGHGQ